MSQKFLATIDETKSLKRQIEAQKTKNVLMCMRLSTEASCRRKIVKKRLDKKSRDIENKIFEVDQYIFSIQKCAKILQTAVEKNEITFSKSEHKDLINNIMQISEDTRDLNSEVFGKALEIHGVCDNQ